MPVVGADNSGFYRSADRAQERRPTGAGVSNPPAVGAAGLGLALDVLQKKDAPHVVKVTPKVLDSEKDLDKMKTAYDPKLNAYYSVAINIPPYTNFTMDQLLACKGP